MEILGAEPSVCLAGQDTAVAPFLLIKGVLARLLMKRKRELQGPCLHVYTCTYVYGYGEI